MGFRSRRQSACCLGRHAALVPRDPKNPPWPPPASSISNATRFGPAMKEALSSFDLMALVAEWQGLVGGYVDKVYQHHDEVILRINVPGTERRELYAKAGKWLVLHAVEERPETLPIFAANLRRALDNARVAAIAQRGFDRVAVLALDRGGPPHELVFELFGRGNVVLTQGGNTIASMRVQSFRGRQTKAGIAYDFPPAGTNPLDLDREGFRKTIKGGKGPVVKNLASALNLGGTYAEELCLRAGVAKDAPAAGLPDAELDALFTALNNVAAAVEQERRPALILKDGRAVDASPSTWPSTRASSGGSSGRSTRPCPRTSPRRRRRPPPRSWPRTWRRACATGSSSSGRASRPTAGTPWRRRRRPSSSSTTSPSSRSSCRRCGRDANPRRAGSRAWTRSTAR